MLDRWMEKQMIDVWESNKKTTEFPTKKITRMDFYAVGRWKAYLFKY